MGLAIGLALALACLLALAHRLRLRLKARWEEESATTRVVVVHSAVEHEAASAMDALRPYASSSVGNPMRRAASRASSPSPLPLPLPPPHPAQQQ